MVIIYFPAVIDCGNLTAPEDGQVTFTPGVVMILETGLDAVANYTCSDGYDLIGDEMRTCQVDGQWAGAEPTCMCKFTVECNVLDPVRCYSFFLFIYLFFGDSNQLHYA